MGLAAELLASKRVRRSGRRLPISPPVGHPLFGRQIDSSAEPRHPKESNRCWARVDGPRLGQHPLRSECRVIGCCHHLSNKNRPPSRRASDASVCENSNWSTRRPWLRRCTCAGRGQRSCGPRAPDRRCLSPHAPDMDIDTVLRTAIREMGTALGMPRIEVRLGKELLSPNNGLQQDGASHHRCSSKRE